MSPKKRGAVAWIPAFAGMTIFKKKGKKKR